MNCGDCKKEINFAIQGYCPVCFKVHNPPGNTVENQIADLMIADPGRIHRERKDHAAIVRELLGFIEDFSSMKIQYLTEEEFQRIAELRKEYGEEKNEKVQGNL